MYSSNFIVIGLPVRVNVSKRARKIKMKLEVPANRPFPEEAIVFRTLMGPEWVDTFQDPWIATQVAFLREDKDLRGISIRPQSIDCYKSVSHRKVQGIARLRVRDVRLLFNPISGRNLEVVQDKDDHGLIINAPFHSQHQKEAMDLASDLADLSEILPIEEWIEAVKGSALKSGRKDALIQWLISGRSPLGP